MNAPDSMETPLYKDSNIEVFSDHLLLKKYYLWKFGQKRIPFSNIKNFKEVRLTYFNGLSRHAHVWLKFRWPFDWKQKNRKEAILLQLKNSLIDIGISAEEPREVALILHKKFHGASP